MDFAALFKKKKTFTSKINNNLTSIIAGFVIQSNYKGAFGIVYL
jgi:hypothetical protein